MKRSKTDIDDFLYKIFTSKVNNDNRLIMIFGNESTVANSISPEGEPIKSIINIVHILDITESIKNRLPVIDSWSVENVNHLKSGLEPADFATHLNEIAEVSSIIVEEVQELSKLTRIFQNSMTAIRYLASKNNGGIGNIIVGDNDVSLAHIMFKTLTGDVAKLGMEDAEKIGNVIQEVISNHMSVDTEDKEHIRKLKAEIEYKLIDSLPLTMKAGDIKVNMDAVVNYIKNKQQENEQDGD